ncbi:hypothetical protein DRP04_03595 [Archaeoglobales archaeon]|nr:MAG: hypothetical protein DRP04_03595 [Archaeoglobales archaeon]
MGGRVSSISKEEYIKLAERFLKENGIDPEVFMLGIEGAIEEYLSIGFSVIPIAVAPPSDLEKKPLIKWKEFQRRKPTKEEIQKWLDEFKLFNIAIVTGSVSNLTVLDFDVDEDLKLDTTTVKTGKGYQYYFEGVRKTEVICKSPDVRIKGESSYVLAPPSVHPTGKLYAFIPGKGLEKLKPVDDLDKIITKILRKYGIKKEEEKSRSVEFEKPPLQFPCFLQAHKETPEGIRNETLFALGMMLYAQGFSDPMFLYNYLTWFNETYCKPPLDEKEVKSICRSILEHEYVPTCKAIMKRLKPNCKGCPLDRFKKIEPQPEEEKTTIDEELEVYLPLGYDVFRDYQPELIKKVKATLEKSSCALNAPTGVGKTVIALVVARWLGVPTLIVEPNKALQDQVAEKDPEVVVVKGRGNYYCPVTGKTADRAPCVIRRNYKCTVDCEHKIRINLAMNTLENKGIVCANFANWWLFRNYVENILIIIDEAHLIVKQLSSPIKVRSNSVNDIQKEIEELEVEIEKLRDLVERYDEGSDEYDKIAKEIVKKQNKLRRLKWLIANQEYLLFFKKKNEWFAKVEEEAIAKWLAKAHWCLLMSATLPKLDVPVIKSDAFVATRKNAPIVYFPIEKLTKTSQRRKGLSVLKFASSIIKLISNYYNGDKVVVHVMDIETTGREIARYLQPYKVKVHEKGTMDKTVEEFKNDDSRFLVIAQAHTGMDWPFVKLQFVVNLPYPGNPYDPEWKAYAEKYGWEKAREKYNREMVDALIQLCGRICRGREDTGITFILDRKFGEVFELYKDWFPEEFKQRLVFLTKPEVSEYEN